MGLRLQHAALGVVLLAVPVAGCEAPGLSISGALVLSTFPSAVLEVRARQPNRIVAASMVSLNGEFALGVPASSGYQLTVVLSGSRKDVVLASDATLEPLTVDVCAPLELLPLRYQRAPAPSPDPGCSSGSPPSGSASCTDPAGHDVCVQDCGARATSDIPACLTDCDARFSCKPPPVDPSLSCDVELMLFVVPGPAGEKALHCG